tara:strand:- start:72896 stop:75766 length:2871 start_codon:yes stop_codon:yes gene_type:complete
VSKLRVLVASLIVFLFGHCLYAQSALEQSRSYFHIKISSKEPTSSFSLDDQQKLFEISNYLLHPERKLKLISKSIFSIYGKNTAHLKYLSKFKREIKHLDIFFVYDTKFIHLLQREDANKLNAVPYKVFKSIFQARSISSDTEGKFCTDCLSETNNLSLPVQEYVRSILNFKKSKNNNICSEVPEDQRSNIADSSLNLVTKSKKIKAALDTVINDQLAIVSCLEGLGYTGKDILSSTWQTAVSTKKGIIDGEWGDSFGDILYNHAQQNYEALKDKNGKVTFLRALQSWSKNKYIHTAIGFEKIKRDHRKKWDLILADENTSLLKKAYGRMIAKNFFLSNMAAMASAGENTSKKIAPQIYDLLLSKIDQEKKEYLMCLSPHAQQKYICRSLGQVVVSLGGLKYLFNFKASNEKLGKLINEAFEKSKFKKAMNKSQLSKLERIELAESKLGRSLQPEEVRGLIEAHEIGGNEAGKRSTLASLGNYTAEQIARKARRLKEAGFNKEERRLLMEEGITGQIEISPQELSQLALMKMDFIAKDKATEIQSKIQQCKSGCSAEEMANLVLLRDQITYMQKFNVAQKVKDLQSSAKYNTETKQFFSEFQELCVQQMDCSLEKIQAFTRVFSELDRIYKPNVLGALSIKAEDGFSFLDRFRDCLKSQMCIESSYADFEDKIKNLNQTLRNCKNCSEEDYAFALSTRPFRDSRENQLFARIMDQCARMRASSQNCEADDLLLLETYRDYRIESPIARGNMENPDVHSLQSRRGRLANKNINAQNALGNKIVEKYDIELVHDPRGKESMAKMRPEENKAIEKYIEDRGLNPKSKPDYVFYHRGEMKLFDAYDPHQKSKPFEIAFAVTNKVYGKGQADHILINLAENVGTHLDQSSFMKKVHDSKIHLKRIHKEISKITELNQSNPRQLREVYANIGTLDDPVIVEVYPNFNEELVELSLEQSKRLK